MLLVIVPQDLDVLGVRDGDAGQILNAAVDLFQHGVLRRGQKVLRRGAEFLGRLACAAHTQIRPSDGNQRQSEAIRGNQRQSELIRGRQRPPCLCRTHHPMAIRGNQRHTLMLQDDMWACLRQSEA